MGKKRIRTLLSAIGTKQTFQPMCTDVRSRRYSGHFRTRLISEMLSLACYVIAAQGV
jgi:hypothetical protein